jgi:hypothetical protein
MRVHWLQHPLGDLKLPSRFKLVAFNLGFDCHDRESRQVATVSLHKLGLVHFLALFVLPTSTSLLFIYRLAISFHRLHSSPTAPNNTASMQIKALLLTAFAACALAAPSSTCLTDAQATSLAKKFQGMLSNADRQAANATGQAILAVGYEETSDSILSLEHAPVSCTISKLRAGH